MSQNFPQANWQFLLSDYLIQTYWSISNNHEQSGHWLNWDISKVGNSVCHHACCHHLLQKGQNSYGRAQTGETIVKMSRTLCLSCIHDRVYDPHSKSQKKAYTIFNLVTESTQMCNVKSIVIHIVGSLNIKPWSSFRVICHDTRRIKPELCSFKLTNYTTYTETVLPDWTLVTIWLR